MVGHLLDIFPRVVYLRNLQIDFQSGYTSLQSHQQWRSVPLSPHPLQHVLSPEVLILDILIGIRWNFRVVLICVDLHLITKDFEHFFRCFSAIQDSIVVKSQFSSIPHFFDWVVWFFGGYLIEFLIYFAY